MKRSRVKQLRLLAVGHGVAATGFSRVLHGILPYLPARYDVHHFAVNHRADRVPALWPVYGNPRAGDAHGLERLVELCGRLRPDIVLILGDLWFCVIHALRLKEAVCRPLLVAYCPVDGEFSDASYT